MAETIGFLILDVLLAEATVFGTVSTVSVFAATAVGSAVLLGGALIAGALLSQASPSLPKPSDGTQTLKQAIPPRVFGYGRARIAGAYMLYEIDEPTTLRSFDVMALHHGKVTGFAHWFLNSDLVNRNPSTGTCVAVTNNLGQYGGAVVLRHRLGVTPETAYIGTDEVTDNVPSQWTDDHRGDGIASAMLFCGSTLLANFATTFPYGLPKVSVAGDLTAVFDPRDPNQSQGTPSTWTASRNPVLQLLDFLTSEDHGLGQSWDDMIAPVLPALMAQADVCDELVERDDGAVEPRYASSGFAYLTTDPVDVITAILSTCDGWMTEGPDGTLALFVGKYVAPTVTLTDDHIIGFSIDHGVADEEAVNEIRFSFTPPANDYREADGDPWRDEEAISEMGRVRSQHLALTWVHSHTQARRLAKRAMARHQAPLRGSLITTLYGLKTLGQRWVKVQSDIIDDLANAVIECSRVRIDLQSARVAIEWVLVNPNAIDAWDEEEEEGEEPDFLYETPVTTAPTGLLLADAGGQRVQVQIATPHNPALRYRVGIDPPGAPVEYFVDLVEPPIHDNVVTMVIPVGAAGTYGVRVAVRNLDGTVGTFTSVSNIVIA